MKLHALPCIEGSKHSRKRVGCGYGSGHGKTSTRGHKGGKARSGYSPAPVCSGIPYYRKLPIRGFNNKRFRKEYEVINVGDIAALAGIDSIDREVLLQAGLLRKPMARIKVLGLGDVSRAITVQADRFSDSAREKIEAAGGKVVQLEICVDDNCEKQEA